MGMPYDRASARARFHGPPKTFSNAVANWGVKTTTTFPHEPAFARVTEKMQQSKPYESRRQRGFYGANHTAAIVGIVVGKETVHALGIVRLGQTAILENAV